MAATFVNLGFETGGFDPGVPFGWDLTVQASRFAIANLGDLDPNPSEEFELGWGEALFAFEPADLEFRLFAGPSTVEDFETWVTTFVLGLGPLDGAEFDVAMDPYEDFEEEWSNDTYSLTLGATADGDFDSLVPEPVEDFEDEWDGNTGQAELVDTLFEVTSLSLTFVAPDTVTRGAGSFVTDGVRIGGTVQFFGAVAGSNGSFKTVKTTAALSMTTHEAIANEGPVSVTMRNIGFATFDGGPDETFEFAWTAMTTVF